MPQPPRRRSWALGLVTVALTCVAACLPAGPQRASPQPWVSGSPAAERSATTAAVRRMLSAVVATQVAPGVVVVLRRGARVQVLTAGVADVATGAAMTSDRRFHAASLTKPVVAAVVMRLVQRGDLFLDDTVEEWLPGLLPAGDRITVADLLSHTSGLAEYNRVPAAWPVLKRHPVDQHALVVAAGRAPPTFAPGQGQSYSNTNYAVLGMLVERVTGLLPRDRPGPGGVRPAGDAQRVAAPGPGRRSAGRARLRLRGGRHRLGPHLGVGRRRAGERRPGRRPVLPRAVHRAARLDPGSSTRWPGRGPAGWGSGPATASAWPGCPPGAARWSGHTGDVSGYVSAAYTRRDADVSVVLMASTDRDLRAGLLHDVLETALCGV